VAPPTGVVMSATSPRSALWWASSRSPAAVPLGLEAVITSWRAPTCVTVRMVGAIV